jgi:hypothetical protein
MQRQGAEPKGTKGKRLKDNGSVYYSVSYHSFSIVSSDVEKFSLHSLVDHLSLEIDPVYN